MKHIYTALCRLGLAFFFLTLTLLLYSCDTEEFTNPAASDSEIEKDTALKTNQVEVSKSDWMSVLSNRIFLKDITLVGSEGSMTTGYSNALQRQNEGLEEQLEAGVRMFDFELKSSNETDDDLIVSDDDTPILYKQYMPAYAQLMIFPKYGEPFYFYKHILPILESFLSKHQTEVLFLYVHKSSSTSTQKFNEILNKTIQKRIRLNNTFGAHTTLGTVRNQILVMQLYDYKDNTYLKNNNERIFRSVNQNVSRSILKWEINPYSGNPIRPLNIDWNKQKFGDFDWKMNRIKKGIDSAQNASFKSLFFITYTSGWSSTTGPKEVANNILPRTIQYMEQDMLSSTTSNSKHPRFGCLFTNFTTSENGKKLIDVCIKKSMLTDEKIRALN